MKIISKKVKPLIRWIKIYKTYECKVKAIKGGAVA